MTIDEIMEELTTIMDEAEGRDLTDEEVKRYEELEVDLAVKNKDAEVRARHQAYKTPVTNLPNVATGVKEDDGDELERAFEHYVRTGVENQDIAELRAQSSGAGSEGGYTIPDGFRQKIVDRMVAFGGVANHVETVTTDSGNNLPFPTVDDTGNEGEIVNEGGSFSGGADLVFGKESLGAYSYMGGGTGGNPLRVPRELIQDSAFDIQGLVSRKLGERIARIQSTHIVRGTGVSEPQGLVTGLTGIEIADDTAGVTYDDLITFIHSVDPAYRVNAMWAFNDSSLETLSKIKDSNGDPIWRPDSATAATGQLGGTRAGQTGVLMGYPYVVDQAFVDIDVDDNTDNWGVFGDLREGYVIRRVRSIELLVNPYTRMAQREIEYSAWARMDAIQQNTNAYVALTGETP